MNDPIGDAVKIHLGRKDGVSRHVRRKRVELGVRLSVHDEHRALWIDVENGVGRIVQGDLIADGID